MQETFTDTELLNWLEENVREVTAVRLLNGTKDFTVTVTAKNGLLLDTSGDTLRQTVTESILTLRELPEEQ